MKSEKAIEIIHKQEPMDRKVINRVKKALASKGVDLLQSEEYDNWLIKQRAEAITYLSGTIILMHTKVSASGFFEELIHYGQIKSGRVQEGKRENHLLMEIEAKERVIKHRKSYQVTDYEIENLTEILDCYKIELEKLREEGD